MKVRGESEINHPGTEVLFAPSATRREVSRQSLEASQLRPDALVRQNAQSLYGPLHFGLPILQPAELRQE